jgi:hypothetical protein
VNSFEIMDRKYFNHNTLKDKTLRKTQHFERHNTLKDTKLKGSKTPTQDVHKPLWQLQEVWTPSKPWATAMLTLPLM